MDINFYVWKSRYIYKINLSTKRVEKIFNCTELINYCKKINRNINELNGIAHIKDNLFLILGKKLPRIFLVRLT
ncbi:glutaminyl-peptide cyclotransferase [[Clostridium] ammoniilyticum]|uniref:glutaminyl-peptide cyclotransferase n=1 Tax=[Clostridium] ammoniilyticum TaxID=2981784 RepID=UPI0011C88D59